MAGAVGLAAMIFGFSRVMVGVSKDLGPVIFVVGAGLVLIFGFLFARQRNIGKGVISAICAFGGVVVLGAGIAMAGVGERDELTKSYEEKHLARDGEHLECGAEPNEHSDHKSSGAVAMKSNVLADLTLEGDTLVLDQIAGFEGGGTLTVDRGNPVTVLFHNETSEERRLRVYAGATVTDVNGTEVVDPIEFCTQTIGEGKVQTLDLQHAEIVVRRCGALLRGSSGCRRRPG